MALYRVEKDGITFQVQPEKIEYYADNGWTVYKTVEEAVSDAAAEAAEAMQEQSGTILGEEIVNG